MNNVMLRTKPVMLGACACAALLLTASQAVRAQEAAPVSPLPPLASAPAATMAPQPVVSNSPAEAARAAAAGDELHRLTLQRSQVDTVTPTLVLLLGVGAVVVGLTGYVMANMCAISDSSGACDSRDETQATAVLLGVGGVVVALAGLIWRQQRDMEIAQIDARIQQLRTTPAVETAWNVSVGQHSLEARLNVRF